LEFAVPRADAAHVLEDRHSADGHVYRVILVLLAAVFAATLLALAPAQPAQGATATSAPTRVVQTARSHLGKPWVLGATGMRSFDCSGFVFRVFQQNDLLAKIGGSRKTARGYYAWFRQRGLASKRNPKVGDLIIWGNASHIGIYVGDGMAISALTSGVKRHGVFRVTTPFTAYLHVNLNR
jgi:cell wall-associated NlpC family hydrolase